MPYYVSTTGVAANVWLEDLGRAVPITNPTVNLDLLLFGIDKEDIENSKDLQTAFANNHLEGVFNGIVINQAVVLAADDPATAVFDSLYQRRDEKGVANGYSETDGNNKIPIARLPDSITGAQVFVDYWDADANNPTIPAAAPGNKGYVYLVNNPGDTDIDGHTDWKNGDELISNGIEWAKIDNTDKVSSVNLKHGNVTLNTDDISEGGVNKYFSNSLVSSNPDVTSNNAKVSFPGTDTLGSDSSTKVASIENINDGLDAKIDTSTKGNANGVAPLGGDGKIPAEYLSLSTSNHSGTWDPNSGAPDPSPSNGDTWIADTAGSFGGNNYTPGDFAVYNSTLALWQRVPGPAGGGVQSINGDVGPAVNITTSNVPEGTNEYYTEAKVNANTDVSANTSARHTQNTDSKLDEGGGNEVSATELRTHVDNTTKHFLKTEISHTELQDKGTNTHAQIDAHVGSTANPHDTSIVNIESGTLAQLNSKVSNATLDDSGDSRPPQNHASNHIDGTDDIQDAAPTQKGLMTSTQASKLQGIVAGAEPNNISSANATDLTDGGETSLHIHDNRYYTESEMNTALGLKANDSEVVHKTGTESIGGQKTFTEDKIAIDSPNSSDNLEIGWFDETVDPDGYGIRRTGASGYFLWMPNADYPQMMIGAEDNVAGAAYLDVNNNRPLNLNTLDTGPGSPNYVKIGVGGLVVTGPINYSTDPPTAPIAGQIWIRDTDNIEFIFNGTSWISKTVFQEGAGRNSSATSNQYLRGYNGTPTNQAPILLNSNALLVGMTMNSYSNQAWTLELRKNGSVTVIASIAQTAGENQKIDMTKNLNMNAGDRLHIYCNGTDVEYPRGDIYYRWRVAP